MPDNLDAHLFVLFVFRGEILKTDTPAARRKPRGGQASYSTTAAQAGVDNNNADAMAADMATPLTTMAQVLETIRNYTIGLIRPGVFDLIGEWSSW